MHRSLTARTGSRDASRWAERVTRTLAATLVSATLSGVALVQAATATTTSTCPTGTIDAGTGVCQVVFDQTVTNGPTTTQWTVPDEVTELHVVVVGGGGGGGNAKSANCIEGSAGGGGGGGQVTQSDALTVTPDETVTVTVGAGGTAGMPGGTSSLATTEGTVTAAGGASGQPGCGYDSNDAGGYGDGGYSGDGNAGGATLWYKSGGGTVQRFIAYPGPRDHASSNSTSTQVYASGAGGGGGGDSAVGGAGSTGSGGAGGTGTNAPGTSGSTATYGGGGGGGGDNYWKVYDGGSAGTGGGGSGGGGSSSSGEPGSSGTGGGGGGGGNASGAGGAGGSGVVIVQYALSTDFPGVTTTTPPTNITPTSAELDGSVTSPGLGVTKRGIVWEPTTSTLPLLVGQQGVVTAEDSPSNITGDGTGNFSINVSSLMPGTSYNYVAWASSFSTNSQWVFTGYGTVGTFTTPSTASGVTTTTNLQLTTGPNPSTWGQSLTLTATVTATTGTSLNGVGTVTFDDGSSPIAGCMSVPLTNDAANCTTTELSVSGSPHSITAVYSGATSGTSTFAWSQSPATNVTVDPATLTITADSPSVTYGDAVPTIGASYKGFVNGDTSASLTTPPTCVTTTYTQGSPVGDNYPTSCSGAVDPNYTIGYVPGTLTVDPAPTVVRLSQNDPNAVQATGSNNPTAPAMTFAARITETGYGPYGEITPSNAPVTFTLSPVGPGSSINCIVPNTSPLTFTQTIQQATATSPGFEVVTCTVPAGTPVNVYEVEASVGGDFQGADVSVLTVYEPTPGSSTGGGYVTGPEAGDTNAFAYSAAYLKNGQVQGKFLDIEYDSSGNVVHILKGNVMATMAIVSSGSSVNNEAIVTGKATLDGVGNYSYILSGIDNTDQTNQADQYGQQVTDPAGNVVTDVSFSPTAITSGNVSVQSGK